MGTIIEYIPILTTLFSALFFREIFAHALLRRRSYLLWWSLGVLTFGLGTLCESINALAGWSPLNTRLWYIVGALLGGFPLAQGSVYLLMPRRFADLSAAFFSLLIAAASACVMLSPISLPEGFEGKLSGAVFAWEWVRYFSPLINLYSFVFLVGGALYSAYRYFQAGQREARFAGNVLIALGGLLPGIGGSFTRMGYVNVLFVTELIGLVLIYAGYRMIRQEKKSLAAA
jgi:hypothetical protein